MPFTSPDGRPPPTVDQFIPLSVVMNIPVVVPAKIVPSIQISGETAMWLTWRFVRPLLSRVKLPPPSLLLNTPAEKVDTNTVESNLYMGEGATLVIDPPGGPPTATHCPGAPRALAGAASVAESPITAATVATRRTAFSLFIFMSLLHDRSTQPALCIFIQSGRRTFNFYLTATIPIVDPAANSCATENGPRLRQDSLG